MKFAIGTSILIAFGISNSCYAGFPEPLKAGLWEITHKMGNEKGPDLPLVMQVCVGTSEINQAKQQPQKKSGRLFGCSADENDISKNLRSGNFSCPNGEQGSATVSRPDDMHFSIDMKFRYAKNDDLARLGWTTTKATGHWIQTSCGDLLPGHSKVIAPVQEKLGLQADAANAQNDDGSSYAPSDRSTLRIILPRCRLPQGVQTTEQLADVPQAIRNMLSMGPADGPIMTDAMLPNDTRPELRFQVGLHLGNAWVILYQRGGIATTIWANSYHLSADGASAQSTNQPQNVMRRLCIPVIAGLAGG